MAEEVSMSKKGAIGSIRIADEVVGIIAGLAATEIDGVAGMSGGIAGVRPCEREREQRTGEA